MIIYNYVLKQNVKPKDLLEDGFTYSADCKYLSRFVNLHGDVSLWLRVHLNHFVLKVEILDDDYGQYYYPFYDYMNDEIDIFPYLEKVIKSYNVVMDNINCVEKYNKQYS